MQPSIETIPQPKYSIFDPSLIILLISNIVTIYFAISQNWSLTAIMLVYWCQSVIIGIFNVIRILQLKDFSTENFSINGRPADLLGPNEKIKLFTALIFLFHYGFFHFIYLGFISTPIFSTMIGSSNPFSVVTKGPFDGVNFSSILIAVVSFFVAHCFSYFYFKSRDIKKQNIGAIMFFPYVRIIPMHFTIIFGVFFANALPLFLVLKTFADCLMHVNQHKILGRS